MSTDPLKPESSQMRGTLGRPSLRNDEFVGVADVIRFFRRRWVSVFGTALAFAVGVAVVLAVVRPAEYEASAALVVVPPRFASELRPATLSVQGYQRMLESDAVIGETIRRLTAAGILAERKTLRLGDQLESRIFVSRRAEETPLAPIIEAVARARTGDKAAAIANTWVEVFLEKSRDLVIGSIAPTLTFIESQYAREKAELDRLAEEKIHAATDFQLRTDDAVLRWDQRLDAATTDWDRKLVDYKQQSEDLIAATQTETRKAMEAFAAAHGLSLSAADGGAGPGGARDPLAGSDPRGDVERALLQVVTLRIQLAQTPQFLVLEKAITDDALWQSVTLSQSKLFELQSLAGRSLLTQEINPVFGELALRLSRVETDIVSLTTGGDDRRWVAEITAGLEKLQRERSADLAKLLAQRAVAFDESQRGKQLALEALSQKKEQELASLDRERDMRLQQIDRDLEHKRALFNELAANYNQATLARAEQNLADVRLGSPAVPAIEPLRPRLALKTTMALILGLFIGIVVGLVRDVGDGGAA